MYKRILLYLVTFHQSVGKLNNIVQNLEKDCNRCKTLTDSFNFWFERTSRGKYEGGDVAWEEANLKSYARSEIRLVEIQENLCSELKSTKQDNCYALNEKVEQILETWWGLKNTDINNLYTWLCIEKLMYCCPKNHYGEACTPCPMKKNKICNGQGICNGDGTRQGNGTCFCSVGYVGTFCEECDKNYFRNNTDTCLQCHKSCLGCHGHGSSACIECARGWMRELTVCTDINECNTTKVCKKNEYCINTEGSYYCKTCDKNCKTCVDVGPYNCNSCDTTKLLVTGQCVDMQLLKNNLYNALIRMLWYLILVVFIVVIFQKLKTIASILVLCLSMTIYYIERRNDISIISLIVNISYIYET